jgi:membrane protease YdiL (CAAX protease family)
MTPKRLVLALLTILVLFQIGFSLLASRNTPQITSRLQLYQTDLRLHTTELQAGEGATDLSSASKALVGDDPLGDALEQYQTVRQSAQDNLKQFQTRFEQIAHGSLPPGSEPIAPSSSPTLAAEALQVQKLVQQQQDLIHQLDLRIGIIQSNQGKLAEAVETWSALVERSQEGTPAATGRDSTEQTTQVANVLIGLWSDPPHLLPNAESKIQQTLEGWFRYQALTRLYELQQRSDALRSLQAAEQDIAQQTLLKLALVGAMPVLGCFLGITLLINLIVQRATRGKQALLAQNSDKAWETPWDWEIVWQVFIVGFFFVGQFILPRLLQILGLLGINFANFGVRASAISVLTSYVLMAGLTLLVLYLSLRSYLPLAQEWFQFKAWSNWFLWGLGGYFVALPLMIVVSLVNQRIWQGEGGSNPLLQIVLEERDPIALGIFFFTAAVAAPVFEELLFRGFLLPSLTRYTSVTSAIVFSSLLFAIAHLSLSEVLPLAVLGSVLGVVYTRSRSLLAPMLLHSLWNSVTMLGLLILGSGAR